MIPLPVLLLLTAYFPITSAITEWAPITRNWVQFTSPSHQRPLPSTFTIPPIATPFSTFTSTRPVYLISYINYIYSADQLPASFLPSPMPIHFDTYTYNSSAFLTPTVISQPTFCTASLTTKWRFTTLAPVEIVEYELWPQMTPIATGESSVRLEMWTKSVNATKVTYVLSFDAVPDTKWEGVGTITVGGERVYNAPPAPSPILGRKDSAVLCASPTTPVELRALLTALPKRTGVVEEDISEWANYTAKRTTGSSTTSGVAKETERSKSAAGRAKNEFGMVWVPAMAVLVGYLILGN